VGCCWGGRQTFGSIPFQKQKENAWLHAPCVSRRRPRDGERGTRRVQVEEAGSSSCSHGDRRDTAHKCDGKPLQRPGTRGDARTARALALVCPPNRQASTTSSEWSETECKVSDQTKIQSDKDMVSRSTAYFLGSISQQFKKNIRKGT
jgi:hypothetical protein